MIYPATQAEVRPFYLGVTATAEPNGEVTYRILSIEERAGRLLVHNAGLARPTCSHRSCRLANLGAAAVDWAYLLQVESGPEEFHSEQMGFSLAPE